MPHVVQQATVDSLGFSWAAAMRRRSMVWRRPPTSWRDGAFLGNGLLGAVVRLDEAGYLCLEIGRSDVTEHRPDGDVYDGQHRLMIGRLRIRTSGPVQSVSMRLNLWNAELVGRIGTAAGGLRFRGYVHAEQEVVVLHWRPFGEEPEPELQWHSEPAVSPHVVHRNKPVEASKLNPGPRFHSSRGINVCTQDLKAGGQFATAWLHAAAGRGQRCLLTVASTYPQSHADADAIATIDRLGSIDDADLRRAHRVWWHRYYAASVVSIPDPRLDAFYWIQIYKLASATRADRPVLDLMGPWPAVTVWPGIWWNLNIQLCYYPVYAANRLELGESLCRFLDQNLPNFIANVPEAWREDSAGVDVQTSYDCRQEVSREFCNLSWTCHNYWLQYRYSMDEALLGRLYPLLSRSMNLYWHLLREEPDGRLHVPRSRSPEYGTWCEDTNINLALIRWGCQTLLWIGRRRQIDDPHQSRWQDMLERVADYCIDDSGLMIGRGVPLAESHRHYSHLLMIYPLYLMTWEQPEHRELIEKSLRHWIGFEGALQGYTFSGAASIFASIGKGDEACAMLDQCLDRYIQPNTMYCEWDSPVMETPLSAATSVQEMLLQSWGGVIRILPAIPKAWDDVCFDRLRAEGAFLVSVVRKGGRTRCVRIESLAGSPCVIDLDDADSFVLVEPKDCGLRRISARRIELSLQAGEVAILGLREDPNPWAIEDVNAGTPRRYWFGLP